MGPPNILARYEREDRRRSSEDVLLAIHLREKGHTLAEIGRRVRRLDGRPLSREGVRRMLKSAEDSTDVTEREARIVSGRVYRRNRRWYRSLIAEMTAVLAGSEFR